MNLNHRASKAERNIIPDYISLEIGWFMAVKRHLGLIMGRRRQLASMMVVVGVETWALCGLTGLERV